MGSKTIEYRYLFALEGGKEVDFHIQLDGETLEFIGRSSKTLPDWTRLEVYQCPVCPFRPEEVSHCPVAVNLIDMIHRFAEIASIEKARILIETHERSYQIFNSVPRGIGSLIGIVMVTSNCPVLDKLRPMVRFHLPFATIEETLYRSVSTYLLAQYFRMKKGDTPDWELKGLVKIYRDIHQVNQSFSRRMMQVSKQDANINALALLDLFAESIPISIETELEEFLELFRSFLT